MENHKFSPRTANKSKKRVGRGGKRGTFSGHGQKGQRARAGHKIRPAERDILSKFPKLRGIGNAASRNEKIFEIYLEHIHEYAGKDGKVTRKVLLDKGLISRMSYPVKIILRGEPKKGVVVEGIPASKGAKKLIEEKGGSVS